MPDSQGHQHHGITKMEGKRTIDDDDDDDDDDPSYQGNRVPDSIKVMNTMSSKTNNFGQKNEHSDQKSTRMCLFSRFFGEFWGGVWCRNVCFLSKSFVQNKSLIVYNNKYIQ